MAAWLYKRIGTQKYWLGWRANGKQFLRSTGTTDPAMAKEKLREFEFMARVKRDGKLTEEFYSSLTGKSAPSVTLNKAFEDWLDESAATTRPGTVSKYRAVARDLSEFIGSSAKAPMLRDVSTEEIRTFLTTKRKLTSAATTNHLRKVLSVFFIRAIKNGLIRENPMLPIKVFKAAQGEKRARRPFTLAEVNLILSKAPSLFWRYMITGGFFSGLRLGDLVTMIWGSVDLNANILRVSMRKTGRTVEIPLRPTFRNILAECRNISSSTKASQPIWTEESAEYEKHGAKIFSNRFFEDVLAPAGLVTARSRHKAKKGRGYTREASEVSFHCLRHSFVSFLKAAGGSQAAAKALAGHSSDMVSDLYTTLPPSVLAEAINGLPELEQ